MTLFMVYFIKCKNHTDASAASREPVLYSPLDLRGELCTHIIYTFAIPDPKTSLLRSADTRTDIDSKYYDNVIALRRQGVRVSIAVSGLVDNVDGIPSPILTNQTTRLNFVASGFYYNCS